MHSLCPENSTPSLPLSRTKAPPPRALLLLIPIRLDRQPCRAPSHDIKKVVVRPLAGIQRETASCRIRLRKGEYTSPSSPCPSQTVFCFTLFGKAEGLYSSLRPLLTQCPFSLRLSCFAHHTSAAPFATPHVPSLSFLPSFPSYSCPSDTLARPNPQTRKQTLTRMLRGYAQPCPRRPVVLH